MKLHWIFLPCAVFLLMAAGRMEVGLSSDADKDQGTGRAQSSAIAELVTKGKIDEAVKLAVKTPAAAVEAVYNMMAEADDQISLRRIPGARGTLEAAEQFAQACEKTGKVKDLPLDALRGRQVRLQGIMLSDQKEYPKAEAYLRQALQISTKAKDPVLEAGVHNNLGYALANQQLLEEAAREFDTARQMAEEQKDDLRAGSYNFNLGDVLYRLGRMNPSLSAYQRSAVQNKAASRPSIEARAVLMQAVVQNRISSSNPEVSKLFLEAASMFEKLGDDLYTGRSLYYYADNVAYTMDFRRAAEYGEKALTFLTKAGETADLERCYTFLGDMYARLGDVVTSEQYKKLAKELEIKKQS